MKLEKMLCVQSYVVVVTLASFYTFSFCSPNYTSLLSCLNGAYVMAMLYLDDTHLLSCLNEANRWIDIYHALMELMRYMINIYNVFMELMRYMIDIYHVLMGFFQLFAHVL